METTFVSRNFNTVASVYATNVKVTAWQLKLQSMYSSIRCIEIKTEITIKKFLPEIKAHDLHLFRKSVKK